MRYRLLVAEDDNIIREGLIKIINKMMLPIERIYTAITGSDALTIAQTEKPHIIITDIKMPSMNGLDFIEQLKESGSCAKVVILSGYGEFSFAQRAISCNVSEYLLKPIKKEKLYSVLVKLMQQIEQEEEETKHKISNDKKIKEYHSTILKEILEGYQNSNDIDFIFSNAEIAFMKAGYVIFSLYCKLMTDPLSDFIEQNAQCLDVKFKYLTRYHHIICLVNIEADEYRYACDLFYGKAAEFTGGNKADVYAGVSEWSNMTSKLAELVKQSERAIDFKIFERSGRLLQYHEITNITRLNPVLKKYYDEISFSLNKGNVQGMYIGIDRLFDFLQQLSPLTPGLFRNAVAGFILYQIPPDMQERIISYINGVEDIYQQSDSLVDLRRHVKQLFSTLSTNEKTDTLTTGSSKINIAKRYIDENYSKNLSLEEVANHIHFNASYFSNMFKKVTGMYFSDYLQNTRIEKSKNLLMDPQYKIYEIAENVGFLDEKYYFKVFKKLTGVTPNRYRNGMYHTEEK